MRARTASHLFVLYDSTVTDEGVAAPMWDSFKRLSINPIEYSGYSEHKVNEVESLYEPSGTLVERAYFDHSPRKMSWSNMAKFKYFDTEFGITMEGGEYPQFYQLTAMEYHRSGEYYFLDDRGYTTDFNEGHPSIPKQVYIQIRIDSISIAGFATVPAPYFHTVELQFTPIATYSWIRE